MSVTPNRSSIDAVIGPCQQKVQQIRNIRLNSRGDDVREIFESFISMKEIFRDGKMLVF